MTVSSAPPRSYADLHDHVAALEAAGQLRRVDAPINKDTELFPLVRWQFRGSVPEADRKAWLFTNVVDATGRRYDMPVLVGAVASNLDIYSIGMRVSAEETIGRWSEALKNPIPPRIVDHAPCQEVVIQGAELDEPGRGLDALPVPLATPGWDGSPYLSASGYISKDPDSGLHNFGLYRAQIKSARRIGFNPSVQNRPGGYVHWLKHKQRGTKMPAAFIIGGPMAVAYTAMWKIPESVDEMAVAGGLVRAPINMVCAKTVDLMVPAEAEIVIEGFVDTEFLEPEGAFGESHGHMNLQEFNGFMDVTAITHRRNPIFITYMSQLYPSEISSIRAMVHEHGFMQHLREHLGIKGVIRVKTHRPLTGNQKIIFIVMERKVPRTEVWRALYGVMSLHRSLGKIIVAVNDDIDPANLDSVLWAMAFRSAPHIDMKIVEAQDPGHGPAGMIRSGEDSALLVDATLKGEFPPISLPKREYMEKARTIWEQTLGLPPITPEVPWFGYSLGDWSDDLDAEAEHAVAGDFWQHGLDHIRRRRNDVTMNTDVRDVDER